MRRSLFFPLLLIFLGVYGLGINLSWWQGSWWGFLETFWPLILITLGLDILLSGFRWGVFLLSLMLLSFCLLTLGFMHIFGYSFAMESRNLVLPKENVEEIHFALEVDTADVTFQSLQNDAAHLVRGELRIPKGGWKWEQKKEGDILYFQGEVREPKSWLHIQPKKENLSFAFAPDIPLSADVSLDMGKFSGNFQKGTLQAFTFRGDLTEWRIVLPYEEGVHRVKGVVDLGKIYLTLPEECSLRFQHEGDVSRVNYPSQRYFWEEDTLTDQKESPCQWEVNIEGDLTSITIE